ncbi:MAG: threonine-phosphate decarboxylase, partial [Gammaproteobacteria bacterium]
LTLADRAWQEATRAQLLKQTERLAALLRRHGLAPGRGCALFQWAPSPHAAAFHERLARHLTRLFMEPASLRFGLPGAEAGWARLEEALANTGGYWALAPH